QSHGQDQDRREPAAGKKTPARAGPKSAGRTNKVFFMRHDDGRRDFRRSLPPAAISRSASSAATFPGPEEYAVESAARCPANNGNARSRRPPDRNIGPEPTG